MKLGMFSLSLFNPESSHPTEAHTHFPDNIKYTLSTPPPPKFCKTAVLQIQGVLWEYICSFAKLYLV